MMFAGGKCVCKRSRCSWMDRGSSSQPGEPESGVDADGDCRVAAGVAWIEFRGNLRYDRTKSVSDELRKLYKGREDGHVHGD